MRNNKYDQKIDRRKKTLRSPLTLDEKVLVLTERLKQKVAPGNFYRASTKNMSFFDRNGIFTIYKRTNTPDMRRHRDVSFWSHLDWDVADHIETSSRHRY